MKTTVTLCHEGQDQHLPCEVLLLSGCFGSIHAMAHEWPEGEKTEVNIF